MLRVPVECTRPPAAGPLNLADINFLEQGFVDPTIENLFPESAFGAMTLYSGFDSGYVSFVGFYGMSGSGYAPVAVHFASKSMLLIA